MDKQRSSTGWLCIFWECKIINISMHQMRTFHMFRTTTTDPFIALLEIACFKPLKLKSCKWLVFQLKGTLCYTNTTSTNYIALNHSKDNKFLNGMSNRCNTIKNRHPQMGPNISLSYDSTKLCVKRNTIR